MLPDACTRSPVTFQIQQHPNIDAESRIDIRASDSGTYSPLKYTFRCIDMMRSQVEWISRIAVRVSRFCGGSAKAGTSTQSPLASQPPST